MEIKFSSFSHYSVYRYIYKVSNNIEGNKDDEEELFDCEL